MNHNFISKQTIKPQVYIGETYDRLTNSGREYRRDEPSGNNLIAAKNGAAFAGHFSFNQILAQSALDLAAFSPFMERVSLDNEQMIHQYGDEIGYVYFPETSVVSEYQILEDGRMTEVAMIGKEGVTGLEVVLDSAMAKNWMRISVPGKALRIQAKAFKDEFNNNDRFRRIILNYINFYMEQTSQRIICTCYHLAEKRFCSWLLMLCDRSGNYKVRITHEQISQFIGTQRATVSRIIHLLRERELIKSGRGSIKILDRRKMEEMTCSCYEMMKTPY